ncbi:autotransporter-associated beta strand repeat-containing protein [Cephaloticoccus capnophilus]|uniref:autotransporter-associated beta strand repeat-containing protein n=1 Tax=Cephaloticoccus capnophilus TaxID=1548208 RepID=UPI001E2E3541|nr:autotransporter-associated beta strand repeat-containing protein [Cephaloticoccus capnophilus]
MSLPLDAQVIVLVPPSDSYVWDKGAGTQSWGDGANWSHPDPNKDNQVPPDDAAVFFGALSSFGADLDAREEVVIAGGTSIGSLWFEGHEEGPGYTLSSDGGLTLGANVGDQEHIIAVADWYRSRETRIFAPTISIHSTAASTVRISNQSLAGLLISGQPTGINDPLATGSTFGIGSHKLQIRGGSMTHIASGLTGTGRIDVDTDRTQLILNANNSGWTNGSLNIVGHAIAVIKNSGALSATTTVNQFVTETELNPRSANGTLMLRSTLDTAPNGLTLAPKEIYVFSQGAGRSTNIDNPSGSDYRKAAGFSGAIYNDSGDNTISSAIKHSNPQFSALFPTWFYSRSGNLKLTGKIDIESSMFMKDGQGVITLTYADNVQFPDQGNKGTGGTQIVMGELRIENSHWALSGGFNAELSFATTLLLSGGVLGLGVDTHFTRKVSDGGWENGALPAGSVKWIGARGGFLARGTTEKTVNLTVSHGPPISSSVDNVTAGGRVNWHKGGFMGSWEHRFADKDTINMQNGGRLVLGSETYEGFLHWKNDIYFGNHAQFQAEYEALLADAGLDTNSRYTNQRVIEIQEGVAQMEGALSGEGFGLVKTGEGLLRLTSSASSYDGGTRIEAGALQGDVNNLNFTNLRLAGGVYMPNMKNRANEVFTVSLGTGNGEFRWLGSGGFAAGESSTTIRIGTDPESSLSWEDEHFLSDGSELILGHSLSSATLTWDKALETNGTQTVRVARGRLDSVDYDAVLNQSVSGTGLVIVGDGRLAMRAANALNTFSVRGATVTLNEAGALPGILVGGVLTGTQIFVRESGTLTLDNRTTDLAGRLGANSTLTLDGGTFRYRKGSGSGARDTETLGTLKLEGGSNTIAIEATGAMVLEFAGFDRNDDERATLDLISEAVFSPTGVRLQLPNAQNAFGDFGNMSPWATVNGTDWVSQDANGTITQLADYVTAAPGATWTTTSNINIGNTNRTLDQSRAVRSLRMGSGELNLAAGRTLTVDSGGLLFANGAAGKISGAGSLTTASGGTLYAHVYGSGSGGATAEINARITGGIDFVKAGPETLRLTSDGTSSFRNIYVHGGRLELDLGANGRINTTGKIIVGDRSGTDVLRLPKYNNQLTGERHIVLRGGNYGAGVLEFALKPAGLPGTTAFAGTTHRLKTLEVQGQGVIDFRGGEVGMANYLYIDELIIGVGSKLTIRNWFEGEDYLLVHRSKYDEYRYTDPSGLNGGILANTNQRVEFEGYSFLYIAHYNEDYYEVTPFPRQMATYFPEPSTYGAILGATGLGLLLWRRHKPRRPNQE